MDKLRQFLFDLRLALANLVLMIPSRVVRGVAARVLGRVVIGTDVSGGRGLELTTFGGGQLGDRTIVNSRVLLDGRGGLEIGADVNISTGVRVWSAEHDPASPTFEGRNRAVQVANRVWVASVAVILPGAVIGEGCVIGAGAVVSGRCPANAILVGNPARVVGQRPAGAQQRLSLYRPFFR